MVVLDLISFFALSFYVNFQTTILYLIYKYDMVPFQSANKTVRYIFILTYDIEVAQSGFCLASVDLTHVGSLVRPLDIFDVKIPRPMALVADFDPRVASDHAVLNCQNCGSVEVDPCHLKGKSTVVTLKTVVSRYYLVTLFSSISSNDSYATVSVNEGQL